MQPAAKYFVVVTASASLSPFAIGRAFKHFKSIERSQNIGSELLIVLSDNKEAELITKISSIGNIPVAIKFHEKLNSRKGTIYAPEFVGEDTSLILEELKDQGVSEVYRPPNSRGRHILTFNRSALPVDVKLCLNVYKVEVYIQNPLRCKNCLILGHHFRECALPARCASCGVLKHEGPCTAQFCPGCDTAEHDAMSNVCPKYRFEKEVERVKTMEGCSRRVAVSRCQARATTASAPHPLVALRNNSTGSDDLLKALLAKQDIIIGLLTKLLSPLDQLGSAPAPQDASPINTTAAPVPTQGPPTAVKLSKRSRQNNPAQTHLEEYQDKLRALQQLAAVPLPSFQPDNNDMEIQCDTDVHIATVPGIAAKDYTQGRPIKLKFRDEVEDQGSSSVPATPIKRMLEEPSPSNGPPLKTAHPRGKNSHLNIS